MYIKYIYSNIKQEEMLAFPKSSGFCQIITQGTDINSLTSDASPEHYLNGLHQVIFLFACS